MRESTKERRTSDFGRRIGILVDAGPRLGYGHAVRCLRLARAIGESVSIYPVSEECRRFCESNGFRAQIRKPESAMYPSLMITDLRTPNRMSAAIRSQGSTHVSIHDLGLAQCKSDIAIDGSVVRLFPFARNKRALFVGTPYMMTRPPISRTSLEDSVFVTLGGGESAEAASWIAERLRPLGLRVRTTRGFGSASGTPEEEIENAMRTCRLAISASGTALYDLLASGIPTIAVAVDRLQLRTADAFHEMGAVVSAGLIDQLSPRRLVNLCQGLLNNSSLMTLMAATGSRLVDGQGVSRVVDILRREVCLMEPTKTFTVC